MPEYESMGFTRSLYLVFHNDDGQQMIYSSFLRRIPELSIFHHPSSPPSIKALDLLRAAASGPYPPNKPNAPPLQFNLEVVESPPTKDQLATIMSYLPSKTSGAKPPPSELLSAHPNGENSGAASSNLSTIADLGRKNPLALKWPIVVDWAGGQASIGDVEGVKSILETIRQKRDGELKDGDEVKPKGWFS